MNSGSVAYQKGDLITIKQASMVCVVSGDSKSFRVMKNPTNAIFLSYRANNEEDRRVFEYLKTSSPIIRACKIAIGNDIAYVDAKSFFFHIQRQEAT